MAEQLADWITPENAIPFVQALALLVGATFDQADIDAIELGLRQTDAEDNSRFAYVLKSSVSGRRIDVELANYVGGSALDVRLIVPTRLVQAANTVIMICQNFRLASDW